MQKKTRGKWGGEGGKEEPDKRKKVIGKEPNQEAQKGRQCLSGSENEIRRLRRPWRQTRETGGETR